MTDTRIKRAAIYARVSKDKVGAGLGVARQQADCEALAKRMDLEVVEVFTDNDLSAYSGKPRPSYQALLEVMKAGRIDVVLTWHSDRLHRSTVELEHWIVACEPRGIEVHTVKAGPLDLATPSGRLMARQLGAFARYESEHRGERVASKLEELAREGKFMGGTRPFGYTADGMHLEPDEAVLVADGTDRLLRGESLRAIAEVFRASGTRTTIRGNEWTAPAVRDVLMRARNAARMVHRGREVGDAAWPAIVSVEQWRAVCTTLTSPGRRTNPGNQPRWLGSMIYKCGICGDVLIVGTSGKRRAPSYRCQASSRERGSSHHVTRAAPALDEYVTMQLLDRLQRPEAVDLFEDDHSPSSDVDTMRFELAGVSTQRDELAARFGRGEVTLSMLDAANVGLDARQRNLETQLASTQVRSVGSLLAGADDVEEGWYALSLSQKRSILSELLQVVVHPAPRGRRPDGSYFDPSPSSVELRWKSGER